MLEMAFLKMATTAALEDLRYVTSETATSTDAKHRRGPLISKIACHRELGACSPEATDVASRPLDQCAGEPISPRMSAQTPGSSWLTAEIFGKSGSQFKSHVSLPAREPRLRRAARVLAKFACTILSYRDRILTSLYQRGARNIAKQWNRLDEENSNDVLHGEVGDDG